MSKKPSQLLRPNSYYSVLRPYFVDVELPKSQSSGRNGNGDHNNNRNSATSQAPNATKVRNTKQANGAQHPMRAFNFNVNPLWRHGSPHVHTHNHPPHAPHPSHPRHQHQQHHLHPHQHQQHHMHHQQHHLHHQQHHLHHQHQQTHHQQLQQAQPTYKKQQPAAQQRKWQKTVEQLARAVTEKQKRSKQKQKPAVAAASESMFVSVSSDKHQLHLEEEEEEQIKAAATETIMYRSLPIFEVLPPLATNNAQSLVYQNSYLLDGVQYDYGGGRQQQSQANSGKLKLNYVRFLKSISTHSNPSDRDIVFGNAKVLLTKAHGWEPSRIDWLVELERRHELRRQRRQRGGGAAWGEDEPAFDICCFPCNNILLWRGGWLH